MYQFITGPLLWFSFAVFIIGSIVRIVRYIKGLHWQMDRVAYTVYPLAAIKGALRSIIFWIIPFGTRSWRTKPGMTILFFVFHIGLIVTPIFLKAHNIILKERWGISLWTMSEWFADLLTVAVIITCIFIVLRRISLPEVRILTTAYDYLLLLISIAPFVTGLLATHQIGGYQFWLIIHILCGEILLIAIPLTKLSHVVLFFMSRAQLGMDYGIKRGGMRGKSLAW